MRLFVSEFICGGGWSGGERPASLVREGAAMLRAFLGDLLRLPGVCVVTTWDRRLGSELGIASPAVEVIPLSGPEEEQLVFDRLCREVDCVYVIAPELDHELSRRVSAISRQKPLSQTGNCSVAAIDLCGDKWALFDHFTQQGIPTIPTVCVDSGNDVSTLGWPRVLKLRWGAGSQAMQRVDSPLDWDRAIRSYDPASYSTAAIAQPFVEGFALSVGAIIDRAGTVHLLPIADQFIDLAGGFAYRGGRIPSTHAGGSLDALLRRALATIPGLFGYVGIDVLIPASFPDQPPGQVPLTERSSIGPPLIVEINPRLTTSYVGYQQLCIDNLAGLWIGPESVLAPLRWRPGAVEFDAAGVFQ